jgi:hypothetical protein
MEKAIVNQRRVILKFFYAAPGVKSNDLGAVLKPIAYLITALNLCVFAAAQSPVAIVESTLPILDAGVEIRIPLHAIGGVPPYHWQLTAGDLPDGVALTPDGILTGRPTKPGDFAATITVFDSGHPAHSINKELRSTVAASLLLDWLRPPLIHGNQVDGAVEVSNGSKDNYDLTVFIVAVNEIGRATALGYQHFKLRAGTTKVPISFKETLPRGAYTVHADAIAEIAEKKSILRQRLQTSTALPVTQGP